MKRVLSLAALVLAFWMAGACAGASPSMGSAAVSSQKNDFYAAVQRKDFARAVEIAKAYLGRNPADDVFRLDFAYALINAGRREEAFEQMLRLQSSADSVVAANAAREAASLLLQRGYEQAAKGDHKGAADSFSDYLTRKPDDDRVRLQFAYELNAAGRNAQALEEFRRLSASSDPSVAAKARQAAENLSPPARARYVAPRGSLYGYVIHDSRFADTFYGADVRYDLAHSAIVPYLIAHLSNDTRSGAPGASEVYNDDALVLSTGVRTELAKGLSIFAEAGQSIGLRGKNSFGEARYGLTYFAERGRASGGHTTIDASGVEYSRFANVICYAALTHDFPMSGPLRGVAGINGALDAHRLYYNNYAEAYGGLQLGLGRWAKVRLIHAYGSYLSRGVAPPSRSFESTRAELLFGFSFK